MKKQLTNLGKALHLQHTGVHQFIYLSKIPTKMTNQTLHE